MTSLTPIKLARYVKDYDYEITVDQAEIILELLSNTLDVFNSEDIQMATDFIVNGDKSRYAEYFE